MSSFKSPELPESPRGRMFSKREFLKRGLLLSPLLFNTSCKIHHRIDLEELERKKEPGKREFRPINANGKNNQELKKDHKPHDIEETPENKHKGPHRINKGYENQRWKPSTSLRGPLTTKVNMYWTIDDSTPITAPGKENPAFAYIRNLEINIWVPT